MFIKLKKEKNWERWVVKDKEILNVSIDYGKESFKQIILKLLKEEYINYITINEK